MKKNHIFSIIAVILAAGLLAGGIYVYNKTNQRAENDIKLTGQSDKPKNSGNTDTKTGRPPVYDAVQDYLRQNLSTLSPEKEVLGGKFYITQLELTEPDKGEVSYEDGHIALKAQFNYSLNNNQVSISNFKLEETASGKTPEKTPTTPSVQPTPVKLTFQPKQCEQEPWQEWYSTGKTRFIKAPTDEELIKTYYGTEKSINIVSARRMESGEMTCEACRTCNKSYYFVAVLSSQNAPALEALGWTK